MATSQLGISLPVVVELDTLLERDFHELALMPGTKSCLLKCHARIVKRFCVRLTIALASV
jgi:hypothetical protein